MLYIVSNQTKRRTHSLVVSDLPWETKGFLFESGCSNHPANFSVSVKQVEVVVRS